MFRGPGRKLAESYMGGSLGLRCRAHVNFFEHRKTYDGAGKARTPVRPIIGKSPKGVPYSLFGAENEHGTSQSDPEHMVDKQGKSETGPEMTFRTAKIEAYNKYKGFGDPERKWAKVIWGVPRVI